MIVLRQNLTWEGLSTMEAYERNQTWASQVLQKIKEKPTWCAKVTWLADDLGVSFLVREHQIYFEFDADDFIDFLKSLEATILEVEEDKVFSPLRIMF